MKEAKYRTRNEDLTEIVRLLLRAITLMGGNGYNDDDIIFQTLTLCRRIRALLEQSSNTDNDKQ